MMDSIFKDMVEQNQVIVYMDDILIHTADEEELEQRTKEVFRRLHKQDLYLKPKKCEFKKTRVEYLGMII